ncbi:MAG: restriction endonuclease [Betaproteobacteria bacterium]|jgi:restriction system protein|nr:restriction endonuclease [Betaproteobacteria bacterium]
MPIPPFQDLFRPFLEYTSDGQVRSTQDVAAELAKKFELTPEEIAELLPSGRQARFHNRVAWAKSFLSKACAIESTGRNRFRITPRGLSLLAAGQDRIDNRTLSQFPEFQEFRGQHDNAGEEELPAQVQLLAETQAQTPEEQLEAAYQTIREQLAQALIAQVMLCSPAFFEQLVVDLLLAMGYGGSRRDAGQAVGKTADGGIDGIIKEDRLGLDAVYIQAKRWEGTVGSPVVRDFVGSLVGHAANKGVLITTSRFTKDAIDYAQRIPQKVVLIDGPMLAGLMVDFGVGVSDVATYVVKRLDTDYFGLE